MSGRVIGTGPAKWSAWVVPKQGISRPACAHADANGEWVCTIPPTPVMQVVTGGPSGLHRLVPPGDGIVRSNCRI